MATPRSKVMIRTKGESRKNFNRDLVEHRAELARRVQDSIILGEIDPMYVIGLSLPKLNMSQLYALLGENNIPPTPKPDNIRVSTSFPRQFEQGIEGSTRTAIEQLIMRLEDQLSDLHRKLEELDHDELADVLSLEDDR